MPDAPVVEQVAPAHLWIPPRVGSYGDDACDLAELAGRTLDPEQRLAVDAMLSYGPGGRWAALEGAVIQPRQNGKTGGVLLPVVLFDLFLLPERDRIVWTAHLFRTARDAFADVVRVIDGCAELRKRVKKIVYANGEEAVELHNGSRLEFLARSKGGGRGLAGKRLVMDEALFLASEPMGALIPTLSARPNPQIVYGSSAAVETSDHLRNLRDRGRGGDDPSLVWVEWCAPGSWDAPPCTSGTLCLHTVGSAGCALDDESLWPLSNPALGKRRANGSGMTVDYLRAERRALPWQEFGRERFGWHDAPGDELAPITVPDWDALASPSQQRPAGVPSFFLDCSPGLLSASIGAAVAVNGRPHLELADYQGGADWLVARAVQLRDRYPAARFAILGTGAVSALLPDLTDAGITVEQVTGQDLGRACAHLQQLVNTRGMTHSGDPLFTSALAGAVKRDIGDDLWSWSRRKSTDISPLVAATGAAWLLETQPDYDVLASVL